MSRDDYAQQGKQFVSDLRDTVSKKVADNEQTILGTIGKAARWVDEKTGGKYSEQIGKAEAKVSEGVGWAAKQGSGAPTAPGAEAGDGTEDATTGPVGPPTPGPGGGSGAPGERPTAPPPSTPTGPAGPGAAADPTDPTRPTRPTTPPRDDAADWPRPPQA
jgi:MT0933-like antitoxin protein